MTPETINTILWRRIDQFGHESARLVSGDSEHVLSGAAVFIHEGRACRLDYRIACDLSWQTRSADVTGWVGDQATETKITVDARGRWILNGAEVPALDGCLDIDLNFSPSTNLLPIRRLNPQVGSRVMVQAAWLRFPSFALEPLEQIYQRTAEDLYRYESGGGRFVAWLKVNKTGLVTDYPGFWRAETS
jgi:uncharacterized protein